MFRKFLGRAGASQENPEGVPSDGTPTKNMRLRGPKSQTKKARAKQRRLRKKSQS